jgi:hypothetical protein
MQSQGETKISDERRAELERAMEVLAGLADDLLAQIGRQSTELADYLYGVRAAGGELVATVTISEPRSVGLYLCPVAPGEEAMHLGAVRMNRPLSLQ